MTSCSCQPEPELVLCDHFREQVRNAAIETLRGGPMGPEQFQTAVKERFKEAVAREQKQFEILLGSILQYEIDAGNVRVTLDWKLALPSQ